LQCKVTKSKKASAYFDKVKHSLKEGAVSDNLIAEAGELVLQEIFGVYASEREGGVLPTQPELQWLYGMLCLLEKPLLADQAADLNQLLNLLLNARPRADTQLLACLDVNICLITEYFWQRFR
jgi:hypothetical protein